jgi:regulator of replication initiation timing
MNPVDRFKPIIEAHPNLAEEIKLLTAERDDYKQGFKDVLKKHHLLLAENTRLRAALEWQKEHCYNPFEPDNQHESYKRICEALEGQQ